MAGQVAEPMRLDGFWHRFLYWEDTREPHTVPATDPGAQAVRTVAQDQRGATFEVVPGPARFDTVNVGGAVYARVSVRGAAMVESPGRPALPTISLHVAIPEGMSPRLRIAAEEWEDRVASPPVPVAQQRFVSDDPKTGPVSEFRTEPD